MAAKKGNSSKKQTKKSTEKVSSGQRQVMSVVLFGISLFLLAVVFIEGENFWAILHDFFFGIFGVLTYLFPIFLLSFCTKNAIFFLRYRLFFISKYQKIQE